jgi:hypothetical protein
MRISAATILRNLGTYSRKNRLYQAFQELGRVVRTAFLLRFLHDAELRRVIQAATNKSESFNRFVQCPFLGSIIPRLPGDHFKCVTLAIALRDEPVLTASLSVKSRLLEGKESEW